MSFSTLIYQINDSHQLSEDEELLLRTLQISIQVDPEQSGFRLVEMSYGARRRKNLKSISELLSQPEGSSAIESSIVFKSISSENLQKIKLAFEKINSTQFYIFIHQFFDFEKTIGELIELGFHPSVFYLCFGKEASSRVVGLKGFNLIELNLQSHKKIEKKLSSRIIFPFALVNFLKLVLTPALEIKKAYAHLRVSQVVWAKRLHELLALLFFLLGHLYGILIDIFYFFENRIIFVRNFFKISLIRLFFKVKHIALISYGRCIDLYYLGNYVFHMGVRIFLICRYPVCKIYWFCDFQYHKRFKRRLWME